MIINGKSNFKATKQSQFKVRKKKSLAILFFLFPFFISCQSFQSIQTKRNQINKNDSPVENRNQSSPEDDYEDSASIPPSHPQAPSEISIEPKIGLIVGPGFLRSFLAVGILQEFHRARIPINAIIGFEWGSLPAALYSLNEQANEVEWQMLKINESSLLKKTLLGGQIEAQPITNLHGFIKSTFAQKTFEQTKIPFECLSYDFKKRQYFWMKKGELTTALLYCLASPPFSKPYLNHVGGMDLKLAVDDLKQKGSNYIIYIDTLGTKNDLFDDSLSPEARLLWSHLQNQLIKSRPLIDTVIDTSSATFSVLDFDSRREMIRKGQELGQQALKKLGPKLKL